MRNSRWVAPGLCLVAALSGAGPVAAQMRSNMPQVQTAPQREDPYAAAEQTAAAFRRWSEANGRPTILVFWNRELSDETTTRNRLHLTDDTVVRAAPGVLSSQRDVIVEDERITGDQRYTLNSSTSVAIESGFLTAFMSAGGQMMDRNALLRQVSVSASASDRADQQFLEAVALQQGVEYLVELLADEDGSSPTGMTFAVKVTYLPASRIVARFVAHGAPPEGRRRLVAAAGGFQREGSRAPSADAIGAQLAVETMASLF